jgi:hypothetical protein
VYVLGFVLWLAYGASLGNPAIVVLNVVSLIVGTAALLVAVRFHPVVAQSRWSSSTSSAWTR